MTISFNCPECDKAFRVADEKGGKRIKCSGCEAVITIPDGDDEFEHEPEPVRRSKRPAQRKGNGSKGKSPGVSPVVWIGGAGAAVVLIGVLVWVMMPGRGGNAPGRQVANSARSPEQVASDKAQTRKKLQRLGLAMHNHHDINQQFPVVAANGYVDNDGAPKP